MIKDFNELSEIELAKLRKEEWEYKVKDDADKHVATIKFSIPTNKRINDKYKHLEVFYGNRRVYRKDIPIKQYYYEQGNIVSNVSKLYEHENFGIRQTDIAMIELGDRMYEISNEYTFEEIEKGHFPLTISLKPIDYEVEEAELHDLVTYALPYSLTVYKRNQLVVMFGSAYMNGKKIATNREILDAYKASNPNAVVKDFWILELDCLWDKGLNEFVYKYSIEKLGVAPESYYTTNASGEFDVSDKGGVNNAAISRQG